MTNTLELTADAEAFLREYVYRYEYIAKNIPSSLPMHAVPFTSVGAMRAAVTASGSHFFTHSAMKYFNSRVAPGIIGSRFFITSERMEGFNRSYKVRWIENNGTGGRLDVYNFDESFDSLAKARAFARKAHALLPFPGSEA